ncbi:MAG: hypothetical protein FD145_312 [Candidatus Saganbacteria bacterium]|uniref:Uncharacterized protein n=1 Tax=Candidatus Saganbacteria bacterium TaxID=2575572 RepID=A0A833NXH5_UNCSA|nr:MAG: hypothetical protein FD145_312 [Candidatus Saganbacteria bacterium]
MLTRLERILKNLFSVAQKVELKITQIREGLSELESSYELWAQYLFLFVVFHRINEVLMENGKEAFDREAIKGCRNALAHPEVTSLPFVCSLDEDDKYEDLYIKKEADVKKNKKGKTTYRAFKHLLMRFDISDSEKRTLVYSYLTDTLNGFKKHIIGLGINL